MSTRRIFMQQAAAIAASAALPASAATGRESKTSALIDCNITIGHWPFRANRWSDESGAVQLFCQSFREKGLTQGWAGGFEGIF
jgi:hypothetical protein